MSKSAVRRLTGNDITWADVIFAMEHAHQARIVSLFREECGEFGCAPIIHVLNIPDEYRFMDPELVELIESGVEPGLRFVEVDRILYEVWDPIGICGDAPKDEYRSYVPSVIALLQSGADQAHVIAFLRELSKSAMGLPSHSERTRLTAEALMTLNALD